jgi:hypothetical protein
METRFHRVYCAGALHRNGARWLARMPGLQQKADYGIPLYLAGKCLYTVNGCPQVEAGRRTFVKEGA